MRSGRTVAALGALALASSGVEAYRVAISDADPLREVCSGMYGGDKAFIEVEFAQSSAGQVALVMYEWKDVPYLGAMTPDEGKTYICTSSAVRAGQCRQSELGQFIITPPENGDAGSTTIFTSALRFGDATEPEYGSEPEYGNDGGEVEDGDNGQNGVSEPFDTVPEVPDWDGQGEGEGMGENQEGGFEGEDQGQGQGEGNDYYDDDADAPERDPTPTFDGGQGEFDNQDNADNQDNDDFNIDEEIASLDQLPPDGFGSPFKLSIRKRDARAIRLGMKRQRQKRQFDVIEGISDGLGQGGAFGEPAPDEGAFEQQEGEGGDEQEHRGDEEEEHDDEDDDHDDDDHDDEEDHDDHDDEDDDKEEDEDEEVDHEDDHQHTWVEPGSHSEGVQQYTHAIRYPVKKTGYYCVGVVPVTLVNSRRSIPGTIVKKRSPPPASGSPSTTRSLEARQATHAEYAGMLVFRNQFDGELPAVEYPKIGLYGFLSFVYFVLGCGWAFLCVKHFRELLPMQYYISGTILFLIVEMLAQWAYYRYINKHGGGTASVAFLFVISILNAARNSLSLFLLLIVSMGLSVVTQNLGGVMGRVRILTALHFVFGVIYSIGVVQVEIDSAALLVVILMIFPLSFTLTAFLMWIIVSLNGTILHLSQRKQRSKLAMFKRLWRILVISVIAIFAFFVISTMSLSGRLEEDYAARNWKYRWVLLDASLAVIYLAAFGAIAWLWRPTRDNVRFAMSQELAQDEDEADAEDYEIDNLERGQHTRLPTGEEDAEDLQHIHGDAPPGYSRTPGTNGNVGRRGVGDNDENVVFAMGDDSDDEDDKKGYRDEEEGGAKKGEERERLRRDS